MNSGAQTEKSQQGMSLVEMMIAMTISLIVIGAVSGVYLSTSRNYTQDEMLSRMQENARYALHVLAEDLSMAGYWGPLIQDDDINTADRTCPETDADGDLEDYCSGFYAGSTLSIAADDDGNFCVPGTVSVASNWAINIEAAVEVASDVTDASAANAIFECIPESPPEEFAPGSDILVVKRVEGQEIPSTPDHGDDAGQIFLRTNGSEAMLFTYQTDVDASEGTETSDWRYSPKIYYVRDYFLDGDDGIPTLVRKTLNDNVMETEDGGVAQGIERFRVLFGVDTDGDATANLYSANPAVSQLDNITSARIYVLARSVAEDPSYDNDKTYRLGPDDVNRTFNDSYYRRVFTTTVSLRNPRNRLITSGN